MRELRQNAARIAQKVVRLVWECRSASLTATYAQQPTSCAQTGRSDFARMRTLPVTPAHPVMKPEPSLLGEKRKPRRRFLVLTLTDRCNLDCVYCFEQSKGRATMPLEVAKSAIQREFANSPDFDEIEIDLFGGEPTLCKDLIVDLVAWVGTEQNGMARRKGGICSPPRLMPHHCRASLRRILWRQVNYPRATM